MLPSFSDPVDHRLAIQSAHQFILSLKGTAQQLSTILVNVQAFADTIDVRIAAAKVRLDDIDTRLDDIDVKIVLARAMMLQLRADLTALEARVATLEAA